MTLGTRDPLDTAALRKARGAFFTRRRSRPSSQIGPSAPQTTQFLEPSAGDAEFLLHAVAQLRELGTASPNVHGAELHQWSGDIGSARVSRAGGRVDMAVGDFFDTPAAARCSAVVGNSPYIRFQDFAGHTR